MVGRGELQKLMQTRNMTPTYSPVSSVPYPSSGYACFCNFLFNLRNFHLVRWYGCLGYREMEICQQQQQVELEAKYQKLYEPLYTNANDDASITYTPLGARGSSRVNNI
ncbi:hypothetical protein Lal_00012166 [Lupinus albus]|nr:hypothetical protein Lal_00012166 [Lupinus albus]